MGGSGRTATFGRIDRINMKSLSRRNRIILYVYGLSIEPSCIIQILPLSQTCKIPKRCPVDVPPPILRQSSCIGCSCCKVVGCFQRSGMVGMSGRQVICCCWLSKQRGQYPQESEVVKLTRGEGAMNEAERVTKRQRPVKKSTTMKMQKADKQMWMGSARKSRERDGDGR